MENFNYIPCYFALKKARMDTTTKIVYGVTIYGVTFKIMTPQGL